MPLSLNIAQLVSEQHNADATDCYNDPFVPDNADSVEQCFHTFFNDQGMKELNVERFLKNKGQPKSTKVQQALL